jgi:hypothetical protein
MKKIQILSFIILFGFVNPYIVEGQTKSLTNWNIESRLLISITPNTAESVKIGQFTSFYQASHRKLNAPMLQISLNRRLYSIKSLQADIKVGIGAIFYELAYEQSKNFSFPTLGLGLKYTFPKYPISIEIDVLKSFYTFDKEIYLQQKGGIGLGLNVSYPLPILDDRIRFKVGYQYINKQEALNLDIFKFSSSDPDWKGIYNYTTYNNLISTALEFRF